MAEAAKPVPGEFSAAAAAQNPVSTSSSSLLYCDVCATQWPSTDSFSQLKCGHRFCRGCWELHFETQILQGVTTGKNNQDQHRPR